MVIRTVEEIENLRETILINAQKTVGQLSMKIASLPVMSFLAEVKFDGVGIDPLKGTELNFIEQLNQMFSDLVVLEGCRQLLQLYPDKKMKVNLGAKCGFDIESLDGEVAAECFAVTTAASNRKLEKDCQKLLRMAEGKKKHIFFYARNDSEEKLRRISKKYPEITCVRILAFEF